MLPLLEVVTHEHTQLHEDLRFLQDSSENLCSKLMLQMWVHSLIEEFNELILLGFGGKGPCEVAAHLIFQLLLDVQTVHHDI